MEGDPTPKIPLYPILRHGVPTPPPPGTITHSITTVGELHPDFTLKRMLSQDHNMLVFITPLIPYTCGLANL